MAARGAAQRVGGGHRGWHTGSSQPGPAYRACRRGHAGRQRHLIMSLFNEPFDLGDQRVRELLALASTGYSSKDQIGLFVSRIGIAGTDINWDGALADVWPRILTVAARRALLRELVKALLEDENYAQVRPRIEALSVAVEVEERDEAKSKAGAADHTTVTVVGRRPFVNRS